MDIQMVTVEFLRKGPRHNQLLSPLTEYLAVCGDSPAGAVNVPFEQAEFERQRDDLRYGVASEKGTTERRQGVLEHTGRQIAQMLAAVPGLPGAFNSQAKSSEILHLRIVISASELASLPFELAKLPVSGGTATAEWLQIRSSQPVCLTRHNRSVASEKVKWPNRPRILYITGNGVSPDEHRKALQTALQPWTNNGEQIDDWLTVCEDATIDEIMKVTAKQEFTHVHILAHGGEYKGCTGRFGVSLQSGVVNGRELAQALTTVGRQRIHTPTVVTMATCDSAQEQSPIHPGASVAHDLHEAGIPLVVASQFPLSLKGALPFVETFYHDQLRGIHPLVSLYKIRLHLYASGGQKYHDWASLIVYEALPSNIAQQLHELEYWQMKRALEGSLARLERACENPMNDCQYAALDKELIDARGQLPLNGPYEAECIGTRAASWKRRAQVEFRRAQLAKTESDRQLRAKICFDYLENALADYRTGTDIFLVAREKPAQQVATLHWLLCQVISLEAVLGKSFLLEPWSAAVFSVKTELEALNRESIWGHGSIAELYLIRLCDPDLSDEACCDISAKALAHAQQIVAWNPLMSDQVQSSRRQFERYVNWWAHADFDKMMRPFKVPNKDHWHRENGLAETAKRIAETLGGAYCQNQETAGNAEPAQVAMAASAGVGSPSAVVQLVVTPQLATARRKSKASPAGAIFDVEMLPAENGDCL
jgi:hypothetical protein